MIRVYLIWLSLFVPFYSVAGPKEELRDAENSYLYGDYPRVLRKTLPLIEPDLQLSDSARIARAYELAGLAAFFLEDEESATRHFEKLIRLRPDFRLDPVKVPPPAVSFFDRLRDELEPEIKRIKTALSKHAEAEARKKRLANLIHVRRDVQINSRVVALLPFGIGQFQNDDVLLGRAFMVSELLTAGTSIALFLSVESMRTETGRFRTSDMARARRFRDAQLITGVSSLAIALLGILEAQWHFNPTKTLREKQLKNSEIDPQNLGLNWTF